MVSAPAQRAPVFAALGDETRLRIVQRLGEGEPLSITTLAKDEPVTRQAITKHLHVLQGAGLIAGSKRGREQVWTLRSERLADLRTWVEELSRQWDVALEKLRAYVEE